MKKRLLSLIIAASVLAVSIFGAVDVFAASYPANGTVNITSGVLNVRAQPNTSSAMVTYLNAGDVVTVLGETTGTAVNRSNIWYNISYGGKTGYVYSDYIILSSPTPGPATDTDFEKSLYAQGFTANYVSGLMKLHAAHPNWTFTAVKVTPTWAQVVSSEYGPNSLIEMSDHDSWKSCDAGYFDLDTGKYTGYDGGVLNVATKAYLEYALDPRNFLTEPYIYMFLKATGQKGETASGVEKILAPLNWTKTYPCPETVFFMNDGSTVFMKNESGIEPMLPVPATVATEDTDLNVRASASVSDEIVTTLPSGTAITVTAEIKGDTVNESDLWYRISVNGTTGYIHSSFAKLGEAPKYKEKVTVSTFGEAFVLASRITDISAYMLASRIRQEQGVYGNSSGMGKVAGYEGYYNYWNINTSGDNKYVKGAQYAKSKGWDTPLKSIIGGSDFLNTNYFKTGQNTLYFQKFDVIDGGNGYYWHQYMTNLPAPASEATILAPAFSGAADSAANFLIPVYSGMPAAVSPRPTTVGNNNNYLRSLSIEGVSLSATFAPHTYSYEAVVESDTVTVNAVAYDSGATVSGAGELTLKKGLNDISVTVTSTSGEKRSYALRVVCDPKEPETPPDPGKTPVPSITGTAYTVGEYITGIEPNTAASAFLENFTVQDGTVKILASGGEKSGSTLVCTGDEAVVYDNDGAESFRYRMIIYGDADKNGLINSVDLLYIQRSILHYSTLDTLSAKAADANKDKTVNSVDLLYIQRFILGYNKTIQEEKQ